MYFESYQIVLTIAETKSFSKAAKLLHMSQPAISNKVHSMESYYGITLFHRMSNGVRLTDAGKVFYSYARKFEQLNASMKKDINNVLNPVNQHILIGTSCITEKTLPYILNDYEKKFQKKVNYNIVEANPLIQLKELEENLLDFIFIPDTFDELNNNEYISRLIGFHDVVFIAPNSGSWKSTNSISIHKLIKYPLIIREPGATVRVVLENIFGTYNYSIDDLNVVSVMNSIDSVKSAVLSGLGFALVPKIQIEDDIIAKRLKTIDIIEFNNKPVRIPVNVIYLRNNEMKNPAKHFVEFFVHNKEKYCEKFC